MIMAGGAGTRLWPMSRKDRPKQLLKFIERPSTKGKSGEPVSLLALADRRLDGLVKEKNRYICTAEAYREAIKKDLLHYSDDQILGEPAARDTVNAIGLTAAVLAKEDKNAIFCVLTADHIIEPEETFRERMDLGFRLVEDDPRRLVTFSIKPTYAATGFGYVERGSPVRGVEHADKLAFHVERFVEKPDAARAAAYVASGAFGWNSGMFVWKASTFLEALERFKPESHEGLMQIQEVWGKKKGKETLEKVYPTLPKISVDYAVMEPATRESHAPAKAKSKEPAFSVCTVQMDLKWLDVGSWPSYAETLKADKDGNRTSGEGATVLVQGKHNLVVNARKGHTVALLGTEDLIVVHTEDATLVMPRGKSEELKKLHEVVEERLK